MSDILERVTDRKRLMELLAGLQQGEARQIDETAFREAIQSRVKGQDHVAGDLARLVRLQWGKRKRNKPIASLLFLGPTGTGKTETARAMAEHLYGDEKSLLYFECGQFSGPEAKNHLVGVSSIYVNSSGGGALTRPVLNNPKRIILFDEIEKSWPGVFDLFLSMLGEGRLTEPTSNRVADFTQSIVVLTSNAEHEPILKIQNEVGDPHERTDAIKKHLRDCKVFRPELIGRIDRIYVFKPLEAYTTAQIAAMKLENLARQYGLEVDFVEPELIVEALQKGQKLKDFGARELERVVDELFGNELAAAGEAGARRVTIGVDGGGKVSIEAEGPDGQPLEVNR
jgi:ATP-dependent Clp protease ATP-binding subunit ClpA